MDDFMEQIATRKHSAFYTVMYFGMWAMIVILYLYALVNLFWTLSSSIGVRWGNLLLALLTGGMASLLLFRVNDCRIEYDYTFTNGLFEVDQVLNGRRRRYLTALQLRDVTCCGPVSCSAFEEMLRDTDVQRHNWFLNRDAQLYFFAFSRRAVRHVIIVELSDQMVAMMRSRNYLQQGVWVDADGKQSNGIS